MPVGHIIGFSHSELVSNFLSALSSDSSKEGLNSFHSSLTKRESDFTGTSWNQYTDRISAFSLKTTFLSPI
jgi:hypothetical protein